MNADGLFLRMAATGRLAFPGQAEVDDLRAKQAAGGLTGPEQERLAALGKARAAFAVHDATFHSAMAHGDMAKAAKAAEAVLGEAGK